MISFLTTSIDEVQAAGLRENLAAAAGVPHELLVHDNREAGWGLARSYNHLAARARFPLLCFVHTDVRFLSPPGFGQVLAGFYRDHPEAGVVGFAGSRVKTAAPSGWFTLPAQARQHLVQHRAHGGARLKRLNPDGEAFSPVVVLDGMCLFAPAAVWRRHPFDEVTFPGFHGYDLDFSTAVAQTHRNFVCQAVLAEHFSEGTFRAGWRAASAAYHAKWAGRLPLSVPGLPPAEVAACEAFGAYRWLRELLEDPAATPGELAEAWAAYRRRARLRYDLRLVRHRLRDAWRRGRARPGDAAAR